MASTAPALAAVERLSPRVIRIMGGNPGKYTLQGTNTYLVGTGRERILIDTAQGLPAWKANLARALSEESCTVSAVLLTHWHPDHVRGVPDVLALCPDAGLYKFPAGPDLDADAFSAAVRPIADGQAFGTAGATLAALHCPGHTEDHVAFVLAEENDAVFAGDAVLGHGTAVFEDLAAYMRCLQTLERALGDGARLYPAHGQLVAEGRAKVREYIAHRQQREAEVLATVARGEEGGMTPMEVVKVVYAGYPVALHEPAEGGVRKILDKLREQGQVVEREGRWQLGEKAAL